MVSSVGKGHSEADRAYLAGLIDADGAIMATIESHKEKKFRFRVRIILKLTLKNPNILQWAYSTFSVGYINHNRTTFDWVIKNQQDCKYMLELIKKYSHGKLKQINIALEIFEIKITSKSDLIKVAQLADTLSGYNVRSLGRRKNYALKIQEFPSSND